MLETIRITPAKIMIFHGVLGVSPVLGSPGTTTTLAKSVSVTVTPSPIPVTMATFLVETETRVEQV